MDTFRFGEVSLTRVVEIGRSFYPTASMLPESTPEAWLDDLAASGVTPEQVDTVVCGTCTSTTSAGTPGCRACAGCRPSPGRAT